MRTLKIDETKLTPKVIFQDKGELRIEGRSIPEDPESFYVPLLDWIKDYMKSPKKHTRIDIQLEYVNSGSSKFILAFLKIVKDHYEKGIDCSVNWIYEEDDENLYELGLHYKSILDIPFNLVEIYV